LIEIKGRKLERADHHVIKGGFLTAMS